jgi:hypothetical protein
MHVAELWGPKPGYGGIQPQKRLVVKRPEEGDPDGEMLERKLCRAANRNRREEICNVRCAAETAEDVEASEREKFRERKIGCRLACGDLDKRVDVARGTYGRQFASYVMMSAPSPLW